MKFIKKVKFRGVSIETGKMIYSRSIKVEEDGKNRTFYWLMDEFGNWIDVDTESVSQFIAYDADGNEVYDDDAVESDGDKCRPKIFIELEMEEAGTDTYDFGDKFIGWRLSKGDGNA